MSRTIKEIYNEAVQERNRRLELTEFASDSKLSVMNGILWTVAAVIYSFETLLDVFAVDISEAINNRINGTPDYYANALLQYQQGDELTVREDGLAFGYAQVDETKRIITQVSYVESTDDSNLDSKLVLKIATGTKGHLEAIPAEELVPINAYIGKLKFAGTRIEVISTKGDVLVPRLTVFYDGAVPEAEMYDSIETRIRDYIMGIDFDAAVYVSRLTDAIRRAEHVTDVYIDETAIPEQGVFIACHDTDGQIQPLQRVGRMTYTASGYLKESSRSLYPLQSLNERFRTFARERHIEARMTSQVIYFEWFLNYRFGKYIKDGKDRIFIKDSTSVGVDLYHEGAEYQRPFTVWYNGEQVTTDNEAERPRPFYLLAEEKLINKVSFMVCVPPVTIPPRELVYMLSYVVNTYKTAGKTYLIKIDEDEYTPNKNTGQ